MKSQQRTCLHRRTDRRASLCGQPLRQLCFVLAEGACLSAHMRDFKRQEGGAIAESLAKKVCHLSPLRVKVMRRQPCRQGGKSVTFPDWQCRSERDA